MINKKEDDIIPETKSPKLSFNIIIIAAIVLLVLVVLAVIFIGKRGGG